MIMANTRLSVKLTLEDMFGLDAVLIPKMWLYSLLFLAILIVELFVLFIHFSIETLEFKVFFLLLTLITGLALAVFTVEGLLQSRRKSKIETE